MATINIGQWVTENEKFFLPPVCNKMMHNKQLKVMYIGGPNIRKDYHIEEGEELFYMLRGDMCLKIVERGKHKDVPIKEGEVFVLPARIPHSPQRFKDTVGLVIERERHKSETDCLRYFVGETTQPLFERWFYCEDLGSQLVPVIKEYFASEEHRTGVPNPDKILKETPFQLDEETVVTPPFSLDDWLKKNPTANGDNLFAVNDQFNIKVYRKGEDKFQNSVEDWIWQKTGNSTVSFGEKTHKLKTDDSILIPPNTEYTWDRSEGSVALKISQERVL